MNNEAVILLLLVVFARPSSPLSKNNCKKEWVPDDNGGYKYRVDCSNLGFKKIPAGISEFTSDLLLNGNSISYIADDTFVGFQSLHTLDLSGNDISTLNETVFKDNKKLESLDLSRNRLHCDWKLWWLVDFSKKLKTFNGKCFSPRPLRERTIQSISKEDLSVNCVSVKKLSEVSEDGEYSIRVFSQDNSFTQISIYCYGMDTEDPKEYLTLPSGRSKNYVKISWDEKTCDLSSDEELASKTNENEDKAILAEFNKVRLDVQSITIDTADTLFATNKFGQFGQPAICGSTLCLPGMAKIDLRGTKFQVKKNKVIEEILTCTSENCGFCNISDSIALELIDSQKAPFKACTLPFGLQDNKIPDTSITATSSIGATYRPFHARLNSLSYSGWCAEPQDSPQRLFIDLGAFYTLSGISTQGYKNSENWVTEYDLQYSPDAKNYFSYEYLGYPKPIAGNVDADSVVTHWFEPRFHARHIRITPTKWNTGDVNDPKICLRVELYGCKSDITSYILQQNPEKLCLTSDTTQKSLTYPLIRRSDCMGDDFMFKYHHKKIKHTKSGNCLTVNEQNQFILTTNCTDLKLVFQNVRHASKEAFLIKDLKGFCARLYKGGGENLYAMWQECQMGGFTVLHMTRRGTEGFRPRFHTEKHIIKTDLFEHVSFKCQPLADPHVVFKWTKDEEYKPNKNIIENNVIQKKDFSVLSFPNVTWQQRGDYYCNVWNSDGYKSKLYTLSVNPFQEFQKVPSNQKVIHGNSVQFHCLSYGIPKPTTIWVFIDKNGVFKNITAKYVQDSEKYELFDNGTLLIDKTLYEDEGKYICISRSPGLERNVSALLDVYVTQNFTKVPTSKSVLFGLSALFDCVSEGLPKPQIEWKIKFNHIDRLVTIDSTYKHQYKVLNNGSLLVKSAMVDDEGKYYCISKSPGLITNTSAILTVYVTQEFIIAPVSQRILYHKNASFDCESIGVPPPKTSWKYKKYNEFVDIKTDSKKYVITDSKLTIQKVGYQDEGEYFCFSESPRLLRNVSAKLEVYVTQEFDIIPQSSKVLYGSNYTLTCSSIGIPMPVVEWKFRPHHSKEIKSLDEISSRVIVDDYGLHIVNATMEETGEYICRSYSPGMVKDSVAVVNVYVNQNFTARPEDLVLLRGQTAQFDCISVGVPEPKMTWKFSNTITTVEIPDDERHEILSNNTLVISNIRNKDEGFYTCISESPGYATNLTAQLTVHIKPQVSLTTSNISLSIGRSLSVTCRAAGDPTPDIVWYRVIEDVNYKVVTVENVLEVARLRKKDQGVYFCEAENKAGKARSELSVIVQATCPLDTIPNSRLSSVKFIYFENEKVDITCKKGFELHGNSSLICGVDGNWNSNIPKCSDIDECISSNTTNQTICPTGIKCENTVGSYKCLCGNGFSYSDNKCVKLPPEGESGNPKTPSVPTEAPPQDYTWLKTLINQYNNELVDEESFLLQIQRLSQSVQELEHDLWKQDAISQTVNSLNVAVNNADKLSTKDTNIQQIVNKCQILISIVDHILNKKYESFWKDINTGGNGTDQVMKNLELYITKKMMQTKPDRKFSEKKVYIFENLDVLMLPVTDRMKNENLEFQMSVNNSKTSMNVPHANYPVLKDSVGIAILYKTIHKLLPQTDDDDSMIPGTQVFSVSFTTKKKLQLLKPVAISFKQNQMLSQPTCVFWDFAKSSNGEWSTEGCETIANETTNEVICECNHLTNFAVLIPKGTGMKVIYLTFTLTLAIGAGLCILLAFITCMSHVCCSSYSKSDRSTILSNLTFIIIIGVLLFAGAIFVSAMGLVPVSMATHFCFSLVGVVQLLGVAFFCWTFVEAIQLFYATRTVIGKSSGHLSLFYLIGWGVPMGIVAATVMMIYFNKFKLQSRCVVQVSMQLLILLVGAPASFFILATFVVYVIVSVSMKKSKDLLSESVVYHTKRSLLFSCGLILVHCGVLISVALYLHYQQNKLFHHVLGVAVLIEGIYLIVYHLILDRKKTPKPRQNSKKRNSYSTKDTVAYSPTLTSEEVTSSESDQKYLIKRSSRRTSSESSNKASPFTVRNKLGDNETRDTQMTAMYGGEMSSPSPEMKPLLKRGSSKDIEETIFEEDTITNDLPTFTNGTISKTNSLPRSYHNSLPRCYQKRYQNRDNDESSVDGSRALKRTNSKASSIVSIETHATASSQHSGIPVYFPAAPPHYEMSLTQQKQSDVPNSFDYFNNSNPNSRCTSFGIDSDRMSNISSELSNILNELQAFNTDRNPHDSQENIYNNIGSKTLPLKTFKRDPIDTDLSLHTSTFKPERRYAKTEIKYDENQGKVNGGFQEKHRVRVLRGKNALGEADPSDGLHSNSDSVYSSL